MVSPNWNETYFPGYRLIRTQRRSAMDGETLIPLFGILIPLSAIVLGIGLSFWSIYWNHQKRQLQYRERQLMIEKGMTPPPMLIEEERRSMTPESSLRRGIVLVSLAIGLAAAAIFLGSSGGSGQPMRGLGVAAAIVGSLGVGNLVYYAIARRKPDNVTPSL
jgi:hypothetical protein